MIWRVRAMNEASAICPQRQNGIATCLQSCQRFIGPIHVRLCRGQSGAHDGKLRWMDGCHHPHLKIYGLGQTGRRSIRGRGSWQCVRCRFETPATPRPRESIPGVARQMEDTVAPVWTSAPDRPAFASAFDAASTSRARVSVRVALTGRTRRVGLDLVDWRYRAGFGLIALRLQGLLEGKPG